MAFRSMKSLLLAATALAVAGSAAPALAQGAIEEIVVTAQKRSERLQDVPIAVSAIGEQTLKDAGVKDIRDVANVTPALVVTQSENSSSISARVRGVGTQGSNPGLESAVAVFIDGVMRSRNGVAFGDLGELERIEVLRGPQGTLFGKNASAGVVNATTKRPSDHWTGYADMSYYEGNEVRLAGKVSGPLSDEVRMSLNVLSAKYDGSAFNYGTNKQVNGYNRNGARAKLEWTPSDTLTVTFIADWVKSLDQCCAVVPGATVNPPNAYLTTVIGPSILPVVAQEGNRNIDNDLDPKTKDSNWGLSGTIEWGIGNHTLTSITAYRGWTNVELRDGDGRSGLPTYIQAAALGGNDNRLHDWGWLDFKQFTQELRIASPTDTQFNYVAGLYYYTTEQHNLFNRTVTTCNATTLATLANGLRPCAPGSSVYGAIYGYGDFTTKFENYSAYGQATYKVTPDLRLIGGLRYSNDEVKATHSRLAPFGAGAGIGATFAGSTSVSKSDVSGKVGVQYDVTDQTMAYATWSQGYKGPAINVFFNMNANNLVPLQEETSKNWEIGLKNEFFDRRLVLNLAYFDSKFDGFQTNNFTLVNGTVVSQLTNAGKVGTRGFEVDFTTQPVDGLRISGGYAYTDARIIDFFCPAGAPATCRLGANGLPINGQPLPYAPDHKISLDGEYTLPLGDALPFEIAINTAYTWQSKQQYDIAQNPFSIQPAYGLWDAGIAAVDKNDRYRLALTVKNINNTYYATSRVFGNPLTALQIPRDAQRYVGGNLRLNF